MGISIRHILVLIAAVLTACGPAFEAVNYGKIEPLGEGSPIVYDPGLPAAANVVRNESFSTGLDIWEDWGGSSLLTTGAYSGNRAARVSGSGVGGIGQEIIFRVKTGATYNLQAQVRIGKASDEVYFGVRFFDLSNATIADIRTRVQSTSYALQTVQVTIPKGASSAKVYLWKQSSMGSNADIDDVSMVMTAPPPAPAKETSIANPNGYQPSGPVGPYTLVFNDNFDGTNLNTSSWTSGLWFNSIINGEQQAYRPENARVSGGKLSLVAEFRDGMTTWGQIMPYTSGAITTRNKFAFTFGVVEARLRVPQGAGLQSLFYLEPNNKRAPPEINIMNALGQTPTTTKFNYKFYDINGIVRALIGSVTGVDFSDSYHTFTVEWQADAIRFYVDGVMRGIYTGDSVLRDDAFIVLSLAVGGIVAGPPATAGFPQSLDVDYVRVWQ